MAVAMFMRWPGVTTDQYDAVMGRLDLDVDTAAGEVLHLAAITDDELRVCEVWQTEQAANGFFERRMLPIVRDGWISPRRSYFRSVCGCMPSISAAMLMK